MAESSLTSSSEGNGMAKKATGSLLLHHLEGVSWRILEDYGEVVGVRFQESKEKLPNVGK